MLSNNQLPNDQGTDKSTLTDGTENKVLDQNAEQSASVAEPTTASNDVKEATENTPKEELLVENAEKSYTFRWSYADQSAFDQTVKKKAKRGRVLTFAVVMFLAFALAFALLFALLLWNGSDNGGAGNIGQPTASYADAVDSILPSTVLIESLRDNSIGYGTGFFVRSNGYLATNYHVIEGATTVHVTLYSGEKYTAEVIGYSAFDDIAVLKIPGGGYPVLAVGDSDALKLGDVLIAVGHPDGPGGAWSATSGIVSAVNRQISLSTEQENYEMTMIQTDTALNPGNSGGPICNANGKVVGIVTRKLLENEGMSYALPINGSMEIINTIIRDGHGENVVSTITKIRPSLGIKCYDIIKGESYTYNNQNYVAQESGVLVADIVSGSGSFGVLKVSDIIVAIDGASVGGMEDLKNLLYQYKAGDTVQVTVIRGEAELTLPVQLGKK